jgi:poly(hydroxyalkanoate) depolymerase family esterase
LRALLRRLRGKPSATVEYGSHQQRRYRLLIPPDDNSAQLRPLILMLHGCTQDPEDFAVGTAMDQLAVAHRCLVLYPEQPASANRRRCWNWFRPGNQMRGVGEPAELAALVERIAQVYAVDRARIYVAGISAGGCMAVSLGVLYPELFAAVGVCAGLPYGSARGALGALAVMQGVRSPRSALAAGAVTLGRARRAQPLVIFHGTADAVVAPENSVHLVSQWAEIHQLVAPGLLARGAALLPTEARRHSPRGQRPYREEIYRDQGGNELIRRYLVEGMGHSWPGGAAAGSYTDPAGPPASHLMLKFFLRASAR